MPEHKVLFICEGKNDEPLFLKKMLSMGFEDIQYEIYSYNTNIHILASQLKKFYPDFDDGYTDINLILRDFETNPEEIKKLSGKYTDIIMAFDVEFQHPDTEFDIVKRMVKYYVDSTDMGKLYLNYPMMQSFKHLKSLPDNEYYLRKASPEGYKELVDKESCLNDIRKYQYDTFIRIAVHNLKKLWFILYKEYRLPSVEEYLLTDWEALLREEILEYKKTNLVFVVNTLCLLIVDYNPSFFMKRVITHTEKYML